MAVFTVSSGFCATYTIKGGNVINPNGTVQRTAPVSRTVNTRQNSNVNTRTVTPPVSQNTNINPVNSSTDDDDIIFTQAQTKDNQAKPNSTPIQTVAQKVTPTPSDKKIEAQKSKNEEYLKQPEPNINMAEILQKYSKDPDAAAHKIAIQNNQRTSKGCIITTYSNSSMYTIWCENNPTYSYYYYSVDNPILIKLDYNKVVNPTVRLKYAYLKDNMLSPVSTWTMSIVVVQYTNSDFLYDKKGSEYVLRGYYVGDKYYTADGKYKLTRTARKL